MPTDEASADSGNRTLESLPHVLPGRGRKLWV